MCKWITEWRLLGNDRGWDWYSQALIKPRPFYYHARDLVTRSLACVLYYAMADPVQAYGPRSCSRVYEKSGENLRLQDVISEGSNCSSGTFDTETEADSNRDTAENTAQKSREVLLRGLYQKLSAVQWRKVITLAVVTINCFLVNGSISLIATFFPTKVFTKELMYYILQPCSMHGHACSFRPLLTKTSSNYCKTLLNKLPVCWVYPWMTIGNSRWCRVYSMHGHNASIMTGIDNQRPSFIELRAIKSSAGIYKFNVTSAPTQSNASALKTWIS